MFMLSWRWWVLFGSNERLNKTNTMNACLTDFLCYFDAVTILATTVMDLRLRSVSDLGSILCVPPSLNLPSFCRSRSE